MQVLGHGTLRVRFRTPNCSNKAKTQRDSLVLKNDITLANFNSSARLWRFLSASTSFAVLRFLRGSTIRGWELKVSRETIIILNPAALVGGTLHNGSPTPFFPLFYESATKIVTLPVKDAENQVADGQFQNSRTGDCRLSRLH